MQYNENMLDLQRAMMRQVEAREDVDRHLAQVVGLLQRAAAEIERMRAELAETGIAADQGWSNQAERLAEHMRYTFHQLAESDIATKPVAKLADGISGMRMEKLLRRVMPAEEQAVVDADFAKYG